MKKLVLYSMLLVMTSLCMAACGGNSVSTNEPSPAAISGEAVSGDKQNKGGVPAEIEIRTPYYYFSSSSLTIKERSAHGYKGQISIGVDPEDAAEFPGVHWELYLQMEDEITDISGATIVSHEGTHYIIRGEESEDAPNGGWTEDEYKFSVSFEITVSCEGQIHEPEYCFFSKECSSISRKKYDCELVSLKKDGDSVNGTIRLRNRSGKKMAGWELEMESNFRLTSLEGGYGSYGYECDGKKKREWRQTIFGNGENFDLEPGEMKEISFTGECLAGKPGVTDDFVLMEQVDVSESTTWGVLESSFGGRYGKKETYLVADTVWGTDLFFVFDEKTADGYTATAELTNVIPCGLPASGDGDGDGEEPEQVMDAISDWEIYLECEDTIESITGAEIVSHEGNVYCIRTTDPGTWIDPYSFVTFQVRVSCKGGIHPLGKTYLKRAKTCSTYDSGETEERQEFSFREDDFQKAVSTRWLSYSDLYDTSLDADSFEINEELEAYYERQEWGVKKGRIKWED